MSFEKQLEFILNMLIKRKEEIWRIIIFLDDANTPTTIQLELNKT